MKSAKGPAVAYLAALIVIVLAISGCSVVGGGKKDDAAPQVVRQGDGSVVVDGVRYTPTGQPTAQPVGEKEVVASLAAPVVAPPPQEVDVQYGDGGPVVKCRLAEGKVVFLAPDGQWHYFTPADDAFAAVAKVKLEEKAAATAKAAPVAGPPVQPGIRNRVFRMEHVPGQASNVYEVELLVPPDGTGGDVGISAHPRWADLNVFPPQPDGRLLTWVTLADGYGQGGGWRFTFARRAVPGDVRGKWVFTDVDGEDLLPFVTHRPDPAFDVKVRAGTVVPMPCPCGLCPRCLREKAATAK